MLRPEAIRLRKSNRGKLRLIDSAICPSKRAAFGKSALLV
jgi:hypothetical protein